MRRSTTLISSALAVTAAVVLAGCSTGGDDTAGSDSLQVVATTTQVGEFTQIVGGDDIELTQLLQPGQSAHHFDPSAAQLQALSDADVVVVSGAGLETWLDDLLDSSGFDGTIIDSSTDLPYPPSADDATDEHDHAEDEGHEDHDHADETGEAEDHDHAEESGEADHDHADESGEAEDHDHDHDHSEGDPHIWTSPSNAIAMVRAIEAGLTDAAPAAADAITERADAYVAQLDALVAWMHEGIDQVPVDQRLLVTNHDGFTAFDKEFDVTLVGSIIPSFDDNAEPSAAEIDALVQAIKDSGVQAVFSETTLPGSLAETIASEAGVEVFTGDQSLYADSLGAPGTDGATYIGAQIHNTQLILTSWGATAPEVPTELT